MIAVILPSHQENAQLNHNTLITTNLLQISNIVTLERQ